ncbi:MAG: DMT family transporter [Paludibacteraceae bacterium]|nr:DMT family transporter [Paludibacteraceae bacterium]
MMNVIVRRWLPYIAIIVAMIIWATAGIATKIALTGFLPISLVTCRFALAVLLMLIIGLATSSLVKPQKKDLPLFLLAGFFQPFCYFLFETFGMKLIASPTIAEVLLCTSPLFAPIFAWIFLKENISKYNIIGIVLSSLGVFYIIAFRSQSFALGNPWAVPLLLLAVFSAVSYTILLRKIPLRYNNLSTILYIQSSSLLFFIPLWLITDFKQFVQLSAIFNLNALYAVIYLALFSSVIAFVLFSYVVRQIGVTRANAFNNIRPVFTAIIMLIAFNEQLPWQKWVAMIVVIIGLFICQKQEKTEKITKK